MKSKKLEIIILLIIILIGFIFRFQHIVSIPPGLYPDVAINGNNALQALEDNDFKVFYTDNNGREGLFINLIALSFNVFGPSIWSIKIVAALFGLLTILGLYLLTKKMFNWQIASLASFYLAINFWHVNFSRIGFRAIAGPFFLVFSLYFLWVGLQKLKLLPFALAGILFGLGMHTYISYRAMPLIIILTFFVFWRTIKKDYAHEKYEHLKNQLLKGFSIFTITAIVAFLPLGIYFWQHQEQFLGRATQVSIFEAENPLSELLKSFVKNLGMFNFVGDFNWRHNFAGQPQLFWPIGILFLIGLIKSIVKLTKNEIGHKHLSTTQTLLLSWFVAGMLPGIFSVEGVPHALRNIMALPVVMIFAAQGTWWLAETLKHWHRTKDLNPSETPTYKEKEAKPLITFAIVILLFSFMLVEYKTYFHTWAEKQEVQDAFSANYVNVAKDILELPRQINKYVVVYADGFLVNGVPMPAQTTLFLLNAECKKQNIELNRCSDFYNVEYFTPERFEENKKDIESQVIQKKAMIFNII